MRKVLSLAVLLPALLLSACMSGPAGFSFQGSAIAATPGVVDSAEAARLISKYRATRGLGPVTVNPTLGKIAADHARRMAQLDRVDHVLPGEGSFDRRVLSGGYNFSTAAENIGAGYDSLAEALTGWQKSPHHNDNLLNPAVKEIGIALYNAPGTKFGTYWSLVLAAPYEVPMTQGPNAGPFVTPSGVTVQIH
jgi:uncharacterized protein YkwD